MFWNILWVALGYSMGRFSGRVAEYRHLKRIAAMNRQQ